MEYFDAGKKSVKTRPVGPVVLFFLSSLIFLSSCIPHKAYIEAIVFDKKKAHKFSVSNVQVIDHQIVLTGKDLSGITELKIVEGSTTTDLEIDSKTSTSIVANTLSNVTFAAGKVFNLILSDAQGGTTYTVNFSLCDSTLGTKGFNCLVVPNDKDVMSYDANSGKWTPRNLNGLNYIGTFSAVAGTPPGGSPLGGDYYVISVAGTIDTVSYAVGDWIVYSAEELVWQKVSNSNFVLSVHGRTGKIVAKKGDYGLTHMSDVDFSTAPTANQLLQYVGGKWVPSTVATGGGTPGAGTAGAPSYAFTGNTNTGIFSPGTNEVGLSTNGVERLRVSATGNVGIGATPDANTRALISYAPTNSSNAQTITGVESNLNYVPTGSTISNSVIGVSGIVSKGSAFDMTNGNLTGSLFEAKNIAGTGGGDMTRMVGTDSRATSNIVGKIVANIFGSDNVATVGDGFATNVYGSSSLATSTAIVTNQYGSKSTSNLQGAGSIASSYGAHNQTKNSGAGGNIANGYGTYSSVENASTLGTDTITNAFAGFFEVLRTSVGAITNAYGVYIGNIQGTNKWSLYASDATAPSYFAGSVGVGTAAPSANLKLQVNGAAASKTNVINSGGVVDLKLSNVHLLKSVGGSAITLSNMADGGSYTLIISDLTQTTYTFSGCTNSYFSPANGQTFQQSTYSLLVVVDGANTNCYISWVTGFEP